MINLLLAGPITCLAGELLLQPKSAYNSSRPSSQISTFKWVNKLSPRARNYVDTFLQNLIVEGLYYVL